MNKIGFQIENCRTCNGTGFITKKYDEKDKSFQAERYATACPECYNAKLQIYPTEQKESMERELYEGLKNAIGYEEKAYESRLKYADWYNNNTPGVGQGSHQYESATAMPMWVEAAKQLIKKYEDSLK